jgi:hypothetical protein
MTVRQLGYLSCRVLGALAFLWGVRMLPALALAFAQLSTISSYPEMALTYRITTWATIATLAIHFLAAGVLWSWAGPLSAWFVGEEDGGGQPLDISNLTRLGLMLLGLYTVLTFGPSFAEYTEVYLRARSAEDPKASWVPTAAHGTALLAGIYLLIGPGKIRRFWYLSGEPPSAEGNAP